MCTVTYIPVRNQVFITSNRDEKKSRQPALPPVVNIIKGTKLVYPLDQQAHGTWAVLKENGDAAVLLNGAFIYHQSLPPYRMSRGLMLLNLMTNERPSFAFTKTDLHEIEPFTLVLFEKKSLYEFRWDGNEKYCRQLPALRPHIWSSPTLYDGLVMKKKEQWFAGFLNKTLNPTQSDILRFHKYSGDGDKQNSLVMSRDDQYATVSITGIHKTEDRANMIYQDLVNKKSSERSLALPDPEYSSW